MKHTVVARAGTLPAVYSKLRSLDEMWLDRNKFSGVIKNGYLDCNISADTAD